MGDNERNRPETITLEIEGIKKEYPYGISYGEIAEEYQHTVADPILLVMDGNRLRELHRRAKKDSVLKFITMRDAAGYNAYRRSLCLMMLKAIHNVLGDSRDYRVVIHFVVSDGLYCTMTGGPELTPEFLGQVKEY